MNLRELYKEKGIKETINVILMEKRENSMNEILRNDLLEDTEWEILVNWMIGTKNDEKTENVLIKLEEIFCEQDETFSKENEKEMYVLAGELIYRYCLETKKKRFPLMILCGYNIGYKVKSEKMYQGFVRLLNEWRLEMRKIEDQDGEICLPDITKMQKKMNSKQKENEEEGTEWQTDQDDWMELLELLNSCKKTMHSLMKQNEQYKEMLNVQREESDILWWMINEWSAIYEQPFRKLKKEQIALAAPIELQNLIVYYLGPFAIKQVLYKQMSLVQSEYQKMKLTQLVDMADEILLEQIDFDEWSGSKVQPVLLALKCKEKAGIENWKSLFVRECKINPDEVEMTPEEFSYQFFLELELAELSED